MVRLPKSVLQTVVAVTVIASCLFGIETAHADVRFAAHVHGGFMGAYVRPHCVTDWYGGGWYGGLPPATGFDSSFFFSPAGGYYRSGFSSVRYSSWGWGAMYGPQVVTQTAILPVNPTVVVVDPQPVVVRGARRVVAVEPKNGPDMLDVLQQHAERREYVPVEKDDGLAVRPVSASSRAAKQRSLVFQAEGDRWLQDGQPVKAYLRYLEAQREAEDRGEVYFRQAFALVALGRYSHAAMKLKRGLQVDPAWPQHPDSLDRIYGVHNVAEKSEYLQRVADWTNQDVRDADRLFLMGVLLYCEADGRASEFFQAAAKVAGRGTHLQAFLKPVDVAQPPKEVVVERRRELPPPPPPQEDPTAAGAGAGPINQASRVRPAVAPAVPRGPKLPALDVPPEPTPRELILPDILEPAK